MIVSMARLRAIETDEPSDLTLIERTLAGDGTAFDALVKRYQRTIYRVAYAILRNDSEADIATQDAFVQAYVHLARFEGRAEFETWLTRIAINRCRDAMRRRSWIPLHHAEDGGDGAVDPVDGRPDAEREYMSKQLERAIEGAVGSLSAQQKVIFRLRHHENLSLEEIAGMLGLRAATVRVHLFRAIHKIRQQLTDWMPAEATRPKVNP